MKYSYTIYKENVLDRMRMEFGAVNVNEVSFTKNNQTEKEGISIRIKNSDFAPFFPYDNTKEVYEDSDVEKYVSSAKRLYVEAKVPNEQVVDMIKDWEKAKEIVFPKLINYKNNEASLVHMPHMQLMDLAIVPYLLIDQVGACGNKGTMIVQERLLREWNISGQEVINTAIENMTGQKISFIGLDDMPCIKEQDFSEQCPLYLLTLDTVTFGAAVILNRKILEGVCTKLKCDKLYIIPSSVYEVLVMPVEIEDVREIRQIIQEVNDMLDEEDVLSDSLYLYDNLSRNLMIAKEEGEERYNGQTGFVDSGSAA